jgi:hypothetical protein
MRKKNDGNRQFEQNFYRLFFFVMGFAIGVLADHTLYQPGEIMGWNNAYFCLMWYNTDKACPPEKSQR